MVAWVTNTSVYCSRFKFGGGREESEICLITLMFLTHVIHIKYNNTVGLLSFSFEQLHYPWASAAKKKGKVSKQNQLSRFYILLHVVKGTQNSHLRKSKDIALNSTLVAVTFTHTNCTWVLLLKVSDVKCS